MRFVAVAALVSSCALVGCGEEFTSGSGGAGGTGGGVSVTGAGIGGSGGSGAAGAAGAAGGTGGGEVVGDCQAPEDCADKPGTTCVEGKCTCPSAKPDYCLPEGCIDEDSDLFHCGRCNNACDAGANGTEVCTRGQCGFDCEEGFADCTEEPGCETITVDNDANCGGCGVVCTLACAGSICDDPVALAGGDNHTCVIKGGGSVWCWGANNFGQMGKNTGTGQNPFPVEVTLPAGRTALRIVAGGNSSCAELDDLSVFCWGGISNNVKIGVLVPGLSGVDELAAGGSRGCMVDGTVAKCWTITVTPENPLTVTSTTKTIGVGYEHACVSKVDGDLQCWGENDYGQLGNNTTTPSGSPVVVPGLSDVDAFGLGRYHSCALSAGNVWCWGQGSKGQLGLGGTSDSLVPAQVPGLSNVDAIYPSETHAGVRIGDRLWMWGKNDQRQVADTATNPITSPQQHPLDQIQAAALGDLHTCVLREHGLVMCWGNYGFGVLGNGLTSGSTPTPSNVIWDP